MTDVIHKFTRTVPHWRPRVTPVELDAATPEQLERWGDQLLEASTLADVFRT